MADSSESERRQGLALMSGLDPLCPLPFVLGNVFLTRTGPTAWVSYSQAPKRWSAFHHNYRHIGSPWVEYRQSVATPHSQYLHHLTFNNPIPKPPRYTSFDINRHIPSTSSTFTPLDLLPFNIFLTRTSKDNHLERETSLLNLRTISLPPFPYFKAGSMLASAISL